jgi:hypothetical protein
MPEGRNVIATLPRIDEHEVLVDAPADQVWPFVISVFVRLATRPVFRVLAKAGRCEYDHAAGDPDTVGATVPGFRVARCHAPTEWALEGNHLFSRYALTFRITTLDDAHCRVRAESSAEFPGPRGVMYRALVIGSGGHVVGVRAMLRRIKANAERATTPNTN